MQRRKFSREFKIEAVKLVRERGVSVAQAGRDLDVHENVLRKWVKEFGSEPVQAFPGHGQMKPEQLEIERLRREVTKLKAERDKQYVVLPRRLDDVLLSPLAGAASVHAAGIIRLLPSGSTTSSSVPPWRRSRPSTLSACPSRASR